MTGNDTAAVVGGAAEPLFVQRRWLLVDDGPKSYRFWEESKDDRASTPVPAPWASFTERDAPGSYAVDDGESKAKRGALRAMTFEMWSQIYRQSVRAPADVYNPFGRFYSSGGLTSFVPESANVPKEAWLGVEKSLRAKDPNFRIAVDWSTGRTRGFPDKVKVESGETLFLADISPLGATYAQHPPKGGRAIADPKKAGDPGALKLNRGPLASGVAGGSHTAMMGQNRKIDKSLIESYEGKDREISQKDVKGASAAEAVANAGFDPHGGWEWLHLIAHSMGGLEVQGPQVPGNLVAGTSECNTHMIVAEEMIKKIVAAAGVPAKVFVSVTMYDDARQIGERIRYDFLLGEGKKSRVFHYEFDCLGRQPPLTLTNRASRYLGLVLFGAEKGGKGFVNVPFADNSSALADTLMIMLDTGYSAKAVVDEIRKAGAVPEATFYLLGRYIVQDPNVRVSNYLSELVALMRTDYGHGMMPFFRALLGGMGTIENLHSLYIRALPAFGGTTVPPTLLYEFASVARALDPKRADEWMRGVGVTPEDRNQVENETTRSGDCLYEGVSIALGNPIGSHDILRQLATDFILEHSNLPRIAGLHADDVVNTLVLRGAWNGAAGDLAPIVLASVIGRVIKVQVPGGTIHTVAPIGPILGADVWLYLKDDHYTVNKPPDFDPPDMVS